MDYNCLTIILHIKIMTLQKIKTHEMKQFIGQRNAIYVELHDLK